MDTLPLHERTHNPDLDFDGPADWGAYDNEPRYPTCTCGRMAAYDDPYRPFEASDFAGCRGCDPTDPECKPYGFGIERFEDPALLEANVYTNALPLFAGSLYRSPVYADSRNYSLTSASRRYERDRRWAANSRHDADLERRSNRVWSALCDICETHREAVARYKAWVKRATARK